MSPKSLLVACALLLVCSQASARSVIVVDASSGPGSDYTFLGQAAGAAAPGDVVLIRAGRYDGVLALGSKSITLVAEPGALVEVDGIRVDGLAAGRVIVVRGIDTVGEENVGIVCSNSQGTIWIEDCTVQSTLSIHFLAGGVSVSDCDHVVMTRCFVVAPANLATTDVAFSSTRSGLHLFDSIIQGSRTGSDDGEDALVITNGFALLSGVAVSGGNGANGNILVHDAGDGGDALVIHGADAEVVSIGSTITAGAGGAGYQDGAPGMDGAAVRNHGGTYSPSSTRARSMEVGSPARDDEALSLGYQGVEDDRVWLLYSATPGAGMRSASYEGALLVGAPRSRSLRGTIGSGGLLAEAIPIPDLRAGVEARVLFAQVACLNASAGESVLGTPAAVVILDDSF